MRVWWALALLGCSFHASPGASGDAAVGVAVDAPPMFDDAGHELRKIIFDTATSWNDVGAELFDTSVDPWGSITQAGYAYGGVIAHGSTMKLWDPADLDADLTFEPAVSAATSVGVGLWPGKDINNGDDLNGFGISNGGGTFSMWLEGEIQLGDGANTLAFAAGEIGFLDIAPPHTHDFKQVATSRNGATTNATYNASGAGWYLFRIGFTHTANNYALKLQVAGRALIRTDIRTRGDQVRGLMRTVFDHQMTGAQTTVAQVDENDAINTTFAALPPGAPGGDNWSARWAGQVYIMVPGSFTLQATSDDGNAMSVAGSTVTADHWNYGDGHAGSQTNVTATLDQGWRDIVLDYNQVTGGKNMTLVVQAGPELAGENLPKARLRSVEPRGNRLITGVDPTTRTIQNNSTNGAVSTVTLGAYAGETPKQLDLLVRVNDSHNDQLRFVLTNPGGASMTLNPTNNPGNGDQIFHFTITDPTFLGNAVAGNWTMTVTDTSSSGGSGDSQLLGYFVTMHTQVGQEQIALQGVWRWTGDLTTSVASIDDIDWTERVPSGGTAAIVQIRSCDMDKCADNPAWSDPIVRHKAPAIAMKRYLQMQVTMTSDGTSESEVESLTLAYRRNL